MTAEGVVRAALEDAIAVHQELLATSASRAAEAQHIATEFIVRFKREREPLPAVALTADPAVITAMGNDFETIFSRQVRGTVGGYAAHPGLRALRRRGSR